MNSAELISELTDICQRQAEIIKAQAYALEQLNAETMEKEAVEQQSRMKALTIT